MGRAAEARRFALWSGVVAVAGGLALLPLALTRGPSSVAWGALGWLIMAGLGVGGGAWAVRRHGRPDQGFLVALGTCMLARLLLSAAGGWAAATRGLEAAYAYLIGLGGGYVSTQVFEMSWFLRAPKRRS